MPPMKMQMSPSAEPAGIEELEEQAKAELEEKRRRDVLDKKQRKGREKLEDSSYELTERQKLQSELNKYEEGTKSKQHRVMNQEEKDSERDKIEKFLQQNPTETVELEEPEEPEELESPEEAGEISKKTEMTEEEINEEIRSRKIKRCMNVLPDDDDNLWHKNAKADFKLEHGGILGDMPVTLCQFCARLFKMVSLSGDNKGENLIEWKEDLPKPKIRKRKKRRSDLHLRLIKLAGDLDKKGLYKEASVIDKILLGGL